MEDEIIKELTTDYASYRSHIGLMYVSAVILFGLPKDKAYVALSEDLNHTYKIIKYSASIDSWTCVRIVKKAANKWGEDKVLEALRNEWMGRNSSRNGLS